MQRRGLRRQIIKTRPQRPYIIARIVILLVLLIALVALVLAFERRQHERHARTNYEVASRTAGAAFFRPEVDPSPRFSIVVFQ